MFDPFAAHLMQMIAGCSSVVQYPEQQKWATQIPSTEYSLACWTTLAKPEHHASLAKPASDM